MTESITIPTDAVLTAAKWLGAQIGALAIVAIAAWWRTHSQTGARIAALSDATHRNFAQLSDRLQMVERAAFEATVKERTLVTFDELGHVSDRLHNKINQLDKTLAIEIERLKRGGG